MVQLGLGQKARVCFWAIFLGQARPINMGFWAGLTALTVRVQPKTQMSIIISFQKNYSLETKYIAKTTMNMSVQIIWLKFYSSTLII